MHMRAGGSRWRCRRCGTGFSDDDGSSDMVDIKEVDLEVGDVCSRIHGQNF